MLFIYYYSNNPLLLSMGENEIITLMGEQTICDVSFLTPTTIDKSISEGNSGS